MRHCTFVLAFLAFSCAVLAAAPPPLTFQVAKQVDLGPVVEDRGAFDRWPRMAVTTKGELLFFYVDAKKKIAYVRSKDGATFDAPVVVGPGAMPAVALDKDDNLLLAFQNRRRRIGFRVLKRTGPGAWDTSARPAEPLKPHCDGTAQFPSLFVPRGSPRIWMMVNYQPVFLPHAPREKKTRPSKARTQPILTHSDDGGATWAEPVYVGSDSGDIGTGVVYLRSYRNWPAWFWAFWDCAPPAWGFHDGSRPRGLREIFPHTKYRTACHHAWDTLDTQSGLYFASGLDYQTRAQIVKRFDGEKWGPDILLRGYFGQALLFEHDRRVFAAMLEGFRPHGDRITLYEIAKDKAMRRGEVFRIPAGRVMRRYYTLPAGRRPKGYVPLFTRTVKPVPYMVGTKKKWKFTEPRLLYLRLEPKVMDAATAKKLAAEPLVDMTKVDPTKKKWFVDVPFDDTRIEPRTDPSHTRKIVRVGGKWVIVYADDNPGRLMAAEIKDGMLGESVALIGKKGWNRHVGSAAGAGAGRLTVTTATRGWFKELNITDVDIRAWPKVKVTERSEQLDSGGGPRGVPRDAANGEYSVCMTAEGRIDSVRAAGDSYLGRQGIQHVITLGGKESKPIDVHPGDVIRGLSLCSLGNGRLLCVYAVRRPRPKTVPAGQERMKRFRYTLYYKIYDGKAWPKEPTPIKWPKVKPYRPAKWGEMHEVKGVIYIPETELGRFPTLPEKSHGQKKVPVAWMVPGFHCITRYWFEQDRGGLLVTTEIDVSK